jgi:hypothetical protein
MLEEHRPSVGILGSGPNVMAARDWPEHPFDKLVVINNAWQVRPDWDDLVFPYDFPPERQPTNLKPRQRLIGEAEFVPVQNQYGGFVYAGATMAFTTAYWVLGHYNPREIVFLGCDMSYPKTSKTHFYGTGTADPLREDITLISLEAKAARLYALALAQGCEISNLSKETSRLIAPRRSLSEPRPKPFKIDKVQKAHALAREQELAYYVKSGRYWEELERFDIKQIKRLDALWSTVVIAPPQGGAAPMRSH